MPEERFRGGRTPVLLDESDFDERLAQFTGRRFGNVRDEPQLRVDMSRLQELLGVRSAQEFSNRYGFSRGRIAELANDDWSDLSRRQLRTLHNLEQQVRVTIPGFRVMEAVPDRIWETSLSATIGFFGSDPRSEREALDHAIRLKFARAGIKLLEPRSASAADAMRVSNCIFFGSPKYNPSTEHAIEALWPEKPPAVTFSWPDCQDETRVSRTGTRRINYIDHEGKLRFEDDQSSGVFVICRQPLGTSHEVTTMILAGSTKFGTLQVVEDVLAGEVYVWKTQLKPGRPDVFVLQSRSQKKSWYNVEGKRYRAAEKSSMRRKGDASAKE